MSDAEVWRPSELTEEDFHNCLSRSDRPPLDLASDFDPASEFWTTHLNEWRNSFSSAVCVLAHQAFASRAVSVLCASKVDGRYLQLYEKTRPLGNLFPGKDYHRSRQVVVTDTPRSVNNAIIKSEFFRKWMQPQGLSHAMCVTVGSNADHFFFLEVYRSAQAGFYTKGEVDLMRALALQAREVVRQHELISHLKARNYFALEVLNHLSVGVAIVTARGKLLAANRTAKNYLWQREGVCLSNGIIRTTNDALNDSFHAFLRAASRDRKETKEASHPAILIPRESNKFSIPRESNKLPLVMSSMRPDDNKNGDLIIFIEDPSVGTKKNIHYLDVTYGLTPTESRLAVLIAEGNSVSDVARLLNITVGTARVHLKRIFSKTGVRRQAELVSLVSTKSRLL